MEKKTMQRIGEVCIVLLLVGFVAIGNEVMVAIVISMLGSLYMTLRFGWKYSILPILCLIVMIELFFPSQKEALFCSGGIIGSYVMGTVFYNRYTIMQRFAAVHTVNHVLFEEEYMTMEKENKALHKKIEQAQKSLQAVRELATILPYSHQEQVLNAGVQVLQAYFQAEDLAIYDVDEETAMLQLQVHSGTKKLPNSLSLKEHSFYQQIAYGIAWDGEHPTLGFPLMIQNKWRKAIIVSNVNYKKHHLDAAFLQQIIEVIAYFYEKAEGKQRDYTYENTNVYHMKSFQQYIDRERERVRLFGQPFVCIGMYVQGLENKHLDSLQRALSVRQLDRIAYHDETHMLYILLPHTTTEEANGVRKRLEIILKDKHISVVNWSVLEEVI